MHQVSIYMPATEPPLRLRRIGVRAYKLTVITPLRPVRGLVWSVLIHAALIVSLPYLWRTLPETRITLQVDDPFQEKYESLELPSLPSNSGGGGSVGKRGGDGRRAAEAARSPANISASSAASLPEAIYAGPQEIVSNFRRATNAVQTIRRPDLVRPPKLKFPVRLQSLVVFAIPIAQPKLVAPVPQKQSTPDKLVAKAEAVEKPVVAVRRYERHKTRTVDSGAPKVTAVISGATPAIIPKASVPLLSQEVQVVARQSAVVINAVTLPPDTPKVVPNAEVTGSFAVLRWQKDLAPDPPATYTDGKTVDNDSVAANWEIGRIHVPGSGHGAGSGAGTSGDGPGSESGPGVSGKRGSGDEAGPANTGNGAASGSVSGGIPGISIAGGASPPHLPARDPIVRPGPNYDLMIVSSGSSGGASRDLGVFDHSHVVYTVYISMSDVGGGPDWSMQYALAGQSQEGEGLLVPPTPWKKVPAVASNLRQGQRRAMLTQFVAAIIKIDGEPENVHAVGGISSNPELAVETLKEWRFTPAELNGKAVATQVLVGVVMTEKKAVPHQSIPLGH